MVALRRYAVLWRVPGGPLLLVFGLVARLGSSLTPLGLLLLVRSVTGEYTPAGLAGAAYTLALAAASPVAGRLADRVGPARVLLVAAVLHPVGLVGLIVAAQVNHPQVTAMVTASAFAGATYPPLVAFLRGAWTALTEPDGDHGHLRELALAADTSLFQSVFVIGPLLVAALVVIGSPALVLAASAAITVLGTITLSRGRAIRAWRPQAPSGNLPGADGSPEHQPGAGRSSTRRPSAGGGRATGPLRIVGFPALLACSAGLGAAFGIVTVAVPAYATQRGSGPLAGVLLALVGCGSTLGGICFGAFGATRSRAPLPRQFAMLLAGLAGSYAVLAVMPSPIALSVALFCSGALIAPVLTVETALVGHVVPAGVRTEAYTWVVSVEVAATAAGIQLTGLIVDRPGGLPWAFLSASAVVWPAAVAALKVTPAYVGAAPR